MAFDIHQLIAAISPETYCVPAKRREVRRVLDEGLKKGDPLAVRRAARVAAPMPVNDVALEELQPRSTFDPVVLLHPLERHSVSYDSMDQSLEAFYFTLLDYLEGNGWQVTKLVDHLNSAAGSGLSGDMSRRTMKSQQEAARLIEASQELVVKMLRRVERIKELERQLSALSVGGSPLLPDFRTASDEPSSEDPYDSGGVSRFPLSIGEVRTRLEIERGQLRAQMDLLRLHAHWIQPWFRAAEELHERGSHRADLVTAFNTALIDVVLLARRELPIKELIRNGELPRFIAKSSQRNYTPAVLIELRFRTAPRQVTMGTHVFRGRVEVTFTSYALHDEEVATPQRELERDAVGQLLNAVGRNSVSATDGLLRDIERLLDERPSAQPETPTADVNPFAALWSLLRDLWRWLFSDGQPKSPTDDLAPDRAHERVMRSQAILLARRECLELFSTLKHLTRAASPRV